MIGFEAIGSTAVGELAADAADVLIFAPSLDVTVTKAAPVVRVGASVLPASKAISVTTYAPTVRGGAVLFVPAATIDVATFAAAVRISATVAAPVGAVAVTRAAPTVLSGVRVAAPGAAISVTKSAPVIAAGKSLFLASAAIQVVANAPGISISASIAVPNGPVNVAALPPQILGGSYIDASNTITMNTPYGEIGSSSIGEFAIGEGEPSTRIVRMPPLVIVSISAPFVTAGKTVKPVAANVNITSSRAEIDGRGRKLRVFAIAS